MLKKNNAKNYVLLHINLLFFSFASLISKFASRTNFLSIQFIILYIALFSLLIIYAYFWQKNLKTFPLTVAYTNRSVLIIWGFLWGKLFFSEDITLAMILGSLFIIFGVFLVVKYHE